MPGFNQLSEEEQNDILLRAFAKIQSDIENKRDEKKSRLRSTAIACISYIEQKEEQNTVHIVTANLADSCAYYVIKNKVTGKIKQCRRLNSQLHKVSDAKEKKRILEQGISITEERGILHSGKLCLDQDFELARAFGDEDIRGVSHVPDISRNSISLAADEELLIIVATQGVYPVSLANSDEIEGQDAKNIGRCCKLFGAYEVAQHLVARQQTWDGNSMVITHRIDGATLANRQNAIDDDTLNNRSNLPVNRSAPTLIGVFDGHGGVEVADEAAKNLPNEIFEQIVQKQPSDNAKQQIRQQRLKIERAVKDNPDPKAGRIVWEDCLEDLFAKIDSHANKLFNFDQISDFITFKYVFDENKNIHELKVTFELIISKINKIIMMKDDIDIHRHNILDKFPFFIDKSDSWCKLLKKLRNHAFVWLEGIAEKCGHPDDAKSFLEMYRNEPAFSLHRANHWFQKIGRTETVVEIDRLIEGYAKTTVEYIS